MTCVMSTPGGSRGTVVMSRETVVRAARNIRMLHLPRNGKSRLTSRGNFPDSWI